MDLPTTHDLSSLPRQWQVAFACRSAKRVQPLYHGDFASKENSRGVNSAIKLSERYATGESPINLTAANANAARAARAADDAADAKAENARAAAMAAAFAANATAYDPAADCAIAAAAAAASAAKATINIAAAAINIIEIAHKFDFHLLQEYAKHDSLGDSIDPTESGPLGSLWPFGAPDWWPKKETSQGKELVIGLQVPAELSDEDTQRYINLVAEYATRVHRSAGGSGLTIKQIEINDGSRVGEGVPSV